MSSNHPAHHPAPEDDDPTSDQEAEMLDPDDAAEEITGDDDAAMDSDGEDMALDGDEGPILLQNDSVAHFDHIPSSIFAITSHPLAPHIVAIGGAAGDDEDSPGVGYIFDSTPAAADRPVLPASYNSDPGAAAQKQAEGRESLPPLFKLEGHTDSINALTFTLPKGEFLVSGGLDGRARVYGPKKGKGSKGWEFKTEVEEVKEVNWLSASPHPTHPNTVALGASDGSVWVYTVTEKELQIVQSFFGHTEACTAGSWSADGKLLATVGEDGSLYVWDVFGEAAAAGVGEGGQYVVRLTAEDQRFAVEGGLFSVAIAPTGAFVVAGGAGGAIKVVGLPRLADTTNPAASAKGGKASKKGGAAAGAQGQSGTILADLNPQGGGIESLSFAAPPLTLFAAGSVDGSIALFDYARNFAMRRHTKDAHDFDEAGEALAVVQVKFGKEWDLTSAGMDGVVRRWDARGGTATSGFVREWKGHLGGGDGGGVMGFVFGGERRVVTAGDDGVSLVFEA